MTLNKYLLSVVSMLALCAVAYAEEDTRPVLPNVARQVLMNAAVSPEKPISNVEIHELTLGPKRKGPLHLHPVPVFAVIKEGAIMFQIEGEAPQHLKTGDVFYEPANVRIAHIDNESDTPAKLVVLYMLGKDEHELVRILEK
jgi:quercetin dioxygenase-like cupin family protein